MSEFKNFSDTVHQTYEAMAVGELWVVDLEGEALYEAYLAAFPEGTNPHFRERTEHDCNCCKQYIRRLGKVVSLAADGTKSTVWDFFEGLPYPYDVVGKALRDLVAAAPVVSVFRTKEPSYGTSHNFDSVTNQRYNHFHGKVAKLHLTDTPEKAIGEVAGAIQVFSRGLKELQPEHFAIVLDLIAEKALYRGEEHLGAIKAFQELQQEYLESSNREAFVWLNVSRKGARFRNTVIGSLLSDLADGVELEKAVKSFEAKVAPTNYKRPTSLITTKMVEQAMETLDKLGLKEAIPRRFAKLEDVSVNNVLYADHSVKPAMKDALTNSLLGAVTPKAPKVSKAAATEVSGEYFLNKIVPKAKAISLLVQNKHLSNCVSLTAAEDPETPKLFKWNNDKAWAYDGDVADSMREAVQAAGGRVDGVLRFTHQWNHIGRNASLMDLHVFMPGCGRHQDGQNDSYPYGRRVGWNRRQDPTSGGIQDVDYTANAPAGYVPVENITFPRLDKLQEGVYTMKIHNWALRQPTNSGFRAEIEFGGQIFQYDHPEPLKNKEWITLAEVTLKNGIFTIEHKHPTSNASREKWGVKTETLVPVDTLMLSPNHWDGQAVGNKHVFFMLRGMKNPDPVRGIFNEYLRSDLDQHRKVFEILGSKTKAQPDPLASQLSGLGFSSTRKDEVTAVVDGRPYHVTF